MKNITRKSDIYIIYNKDNGDFYCAAESFEVAEQIIADDSRDGHIIAEEMNITDLHFWAEKK